jgi:N-acetylmuramoyl-L-alanine amidase
MPTGEELVRLAYKHVNESYILGSRVPMANKEWKGPWDCAEFVSWCVYQLTGQLFGCRPNNVNPDAADAYTGYWALDAKKHKVRFDKEVAAATPGAILLREPPGAGEIGHIVISCGNGKTVEAKGAKWGVVIDEIRNRRWDYGIAVPGIALNTSTAPFEIEEPIEIIRIKTPYMTGTLISEAQKILKSLGYSPGPIDGVFGFQTLAAVRAFQLKKDLVPDGEIGPVTARALKLKMK